MSITPRVTRRLYERMQLAPDVKRRTSVPKFDGATPGPDPSGAQPPKYPPSLPSLAPRPLPPFPLSPDTIFIPSSLPTSLLPVFRQTFPDLTPIIGEEVDEFLTVEYLYWNIDVISTTGEDTTGVSLRRETSPIYIYIYLSLSLRPIRLLCKCPETRAKEEPVERRLQRNCYNVKVVTRTLGFFSSSPSSSFSFPLFVFSLFIFRRGARENFHEGRRRFPES